MTKTPGIKIDKQLIAYATRLRRNFHKHPELGFKEYRTSKVIAKELQKFGYQVTSGVAETGVVGLRVADPDSPVILLRFDMDALPINEENSVDYSSINQGAMHACGHDAHMAIGLTIAKFIIGKPEFRNVTIKIVFQPAEEGLGGAKEIISKGVLTNPIPDICLGMHVWNEKPVGWVGVKSGPMMAGADTFEIRINGKGGHGGQPHHATDPFIAAASIIQEYQTIVSRNLSPFENGVVSFGSITGGSASNIIPGEIFLTGTIRYFEESVHKKIIHRMEEIADGISVMSNCEISFRNFETALPLINNAQLGDIISSITKNKFKNLNFDNTFATMGSEDFAYFAEKLPSFFTFFGSANESKGLDAPHHHPKFNIDEDVLPIAIETELTFLSDIVHSIISGDLHL